MIRDITINTTAILSILEAMPFKSPDVSAERATGKLPKNIQRPSNIQSAPLSTDDGKLVYIFITETTEIIIIIKMTVNAEPFKIPLI